METEIISKDVIELIQKLERVGDKLFDIMNNHSKKDILQNE